MCRMHWIITWAALVLIVTGCSKPAETNPSAQTTQNSEVAAPAAAETDATPGDPTEAVAKFLEAVRTGNDEVAEQMLSTIARQKTAALNRQVTPPASDTAKFTVGKVNYVDNGNGAQVACTWTDLDPDGQAKTDEAIWVVRREPAGWRIAGVAAQLPGDPPLVLELNFENPKDMLSKLQWGREEMRRQREKEEKSGPQAQEAEKTEKPVRR